MKHLVNWRRRRLTLALLFCAAIFLASFFLELRSEAFLTEFREFAEKKLSKLLLKEVSIGRIEGGIFRGLTLNNLRVIDKSQTSIVVFEAERTVLGYRLWDALARERPHLAEIQLLSPNINLEGATGSLRNLFGMGFGQPVQMLIKNGKVSLGALGEAITDITGLIDVNSEGVVFKNLSGRFFGLPFLVTGEITDLETVPKPTLDFTAVAGHRKNRLSIRPAVNSYAMDGALWLTGDSEFKFAGNLSISSDGVAIEDLSLGAAAKKAHVEMDEEETELGHSSKLEIRPLLSEDPGYKFSVKLDHVRIGEFNLISYLEIGTKLGSINHSGEQVVTGDVHSYGTLINFKPIPELEASYRMSDDRLDILYLRLGSGLRLFGKIDLSHRPTLDLILKMEEVDIQDLLVLAKKEDREAFSGRFSGVIRVQGPAGHPKIKGRLEAKSGKLTSDLKYEQAYINLIGEAPIVKVANSRIYRREGFLGLTGYMDFTKFGSPRMFEGLELQTETGMTVWEGWELYRTDSSKLGLGESVGEELFVDFKTYANEELLGGDTQREEVDVEYKLKGKESIKVRFKDEESFIGLQHKKKF